MADIVPDVSDPMMDDARALLKQFGPGYTQPGREHWKPSLGGDDLEGPRLGEAIIGDGPLMAPPYRTPAWERLSQKDRDTIGNRLLVGRTPAMDRARIGSGARAPDMPSIMTLRDKMERMTSIVETMQEFGRRLEAELRLHAPIRGYDPKDEQRMMATVHDRLRSAVHLRTGVRRAPRRPLDSLYWPLHSLFRDRPFDPARSTPSARVSPFSSLFLCCA